MTPVPEKRDLFLLFTSFQKAPVLKLMIEAVYSIFFAPMGEQPVIASGHAPKALDSFEEVFCLLDKQPAVRDILPGIR